MNNSLLKSLFFIFLILIFITACSMSEDNIQQTELDEELEEDSEGALFLPDDFILYIGTLPYRGAVLFIDYYGEIDLKHYGLKVDIEASGDLKQKDMQTEIVDGKLISEIIDLMYIPGDELRFTLKIIADEEIASYTFSEIYEGYYPWKDWMLADDEWFFLGSNVDNFVYGRPSWGGVGAHASWDIFTNKGKAVPVYSGTAGIVFRIIPEHETLEIYNPYVGAVVQYGHTTPVNDLYVGKIVEPGEHIANVIPRVGHIHYSIIRPLRYTKIDKITVEKFDYVPESLLDFYWISLNLPQSPSIYDLKYYKDPFYFHEPTTLGYWNEDCLPEGLKEEMLSSYKRNNPGIILPAKAPLE
jgi:hypothetical protein